MLKAGSPVTIICDGRTVDGAVIIASENQQSLMLGFEAILAGHVGMMPVLLGEDGCYRSIVNGVVVTVVVR